LAACLKDGRGSSVIREFGGLEGAPLSLRLRLHLSPLLDAGGKCLGAHCLLEPAGSSD
jgi:hypothetical protein